MDNVKNLSPNHLNAGVVGRVRPHAELSNVERSCAEAFHECRGGCVRSSFSNDALPWTTLAHGQSQQLAWIEYRLVTFSFAFWCVCMRVLKLVRHAILRVLPSVCKSRVRRYFWTWFIVCVVFLFVASLALVSVQFSNSKLPLHLEFDPVYELVMRHPSGNRWLDCTVDRRRELIRKHKRWPFSLTMPPYRIEYPNHCVKRSLYMFEFLRIFGVNPVTDNLETPHVFVLGAHTSLGRAVIRQLKMMNQSRMD